MPKEPGEQPREEEKLIDFSHLSDEELEKMIGQEEANEAEFTDPDEKDPPAGKILHSLITESLRREAKKEQGEK